MGDRATRPSFGTWESLMWTQRCRKEVDVLLGGIPERETHGGSPGQERRLPEAQRRRDGNLLKNTGQRSLARAQSLDQIFEKKNPFASEGARRRGGWGVPDQEGRHPNDPTASMMSTKRSSDASTVGSRAPDERRRSKGDASSLDDYSDLPGNWPLHQGTMMTLRPNARVRTVLDQDLVYGCNVNVKFESKRVKYGVTDDMVYNSYVPKFRVTYRGRKERLGQRVY